jgi:hypothetical protein
MNFKILDNLQCIGDVINPKHGEKTVTIYDNEGYLKDHLTAAQLLLIIEDFKLLYQQLLDCDPVNDPDYYSTFPD